MFLTLVDWYIQFWITSKKNRLISFDNLFKKLFHTDKNIRRFEIRTVLSF